MNEEGCQMGGGWQGAGCSGARGQEMEHKDLKQSRGGCCEVYGRGTCVRRSCYLPGQSCGDLKNDL